MAGAQDHASATTLDTGGRSASTEPDTGARAGDEELLREARERRTYYETKFSEQLDAEKDDLKFAKGDQWDAAIAAQRETDKRPCLTVNQTGQFVKQVTNDQRQNRPRIVIDPADDKANADTAKTLGGMVRDIEYQSAADAAYDTAFERTARAGRGAWRVISKYCDPMSFEQELRITRIADGFSVCVDPDAQEADGSDKEWAFVEESVTEAEHKRRWPGRPIVTLDQSKQQEYKLWREGNMLRVADYYRRIYTKKKIMMIASATGLDQRVIKEGDAIPEGWAIMLDRDNKPIERMSEFVEVEILKINGAVVLERTKWPGTIIPVIEVIGDEIIVEGKVYRAGIIRPAKDPQRMYNYWVTSGTEAIALLPKAPYIGAEGQFSGHEAKWRQANVVSFAYLEYKPKAIGGQLVPPPARQPFAEVPAGVVAMIQNAKEDLKAATGQYRPGDLAGPERSGRAIEREQAKGDVVTFNFQDNLSRAIRLTGKVLVEVIPVYYDTERNVRVIDESGAHSSTKINSTKDGKPYNKVGQGKYEVTVSTGPSYQSKRAEARSWLIDFMATLGPQGAAMIGDLVVRKTDLDDANEIANRLFAMLPPAIQAIYTKGALDNVPEESRPIVAQLMQQVQTMQAELQKYQQALGEAAKQLDDKNAILATDRYKVDVKALTDMFKTEMTATVDLAVKGVGENLRAVSEQVSALSQGFGQVSQILEAMQKRADAEAAARQQAAQQNPPSAIDPNAATGVAKPASAV